MYFMNLKSYILWDLFICSNDEKKLFFFFSFYFILYFNFMIYDLLIERKRSRSMLEKNIPIRVDWHTYL